MTANLLILSSLLQFAWAGAVKQFALPLVFEQNAGQAAGNVRFLARTERGRLLLAPGESVLERGARPPVRIALHGARMDAPLEGLDPLPGHSNYVIGNDPSRWITGVAQFARVRYRGVYDGIDLVYHGRSGELEYDFVVAPGRDPSAIALAIGGAERVSLAANGDLLITASGGELRHRRPVLYQEIGGRRVGVDGRFELAGANEVCFRVGTYDRRFALVIDPVLQFVTFVGGNGEERGAFLGIDAAGNSYVTGATLSADYPVETGAYQSSKSTGDIGGDVFVSKISADGQRLLYSTYFGGRGEDVGIGIAVDGNGNAYVSGRTASDNFPVTAGAFQRNYGGDADAFVLKLNPSGAPVYSTYFGGSAFDGAIDVAIDNAGSAYFCGETRSSNMPRRNAFQNTPPGGPLDSFAAKLNAAGSDIVYATYLGGSAADSCRGMRVDNAGHAYIAGETSSFNFPVLNAIQAAKRGGEGATDGFLLKLSPAGSSLIYSTYLGGSYNDAVRDVALTRDGTVCLTGYTYSPDFPAVRQIYPKRDGANSADAFVTVIGANGAEIEFSTFLGGQRNDAGNRLVIDSRGTVYVAGGTVSADFPVSYNATQRVNRGAQDIFVARIRPQRTAQSRPAALLFSTFFGGTGEDSGTGVAVDSFESIYLSGITTPARDFPSMRSSNDRGGGLSDAFVAKLSNADLRYRGTLYTQGDVPVRAPVGGQTSISFAVDNAAADDADGVVINAAMPAGLTLLGCTASVGTCSAAGGTAATTVPAGLPSNGAVQVQMTVQVGQNFVSGSEILVNAQTETNDVDPDNNTGAIQVIAVAGAASSQLFSSVTPAGAGTVSAVVRPGTTEVEVLALPANGCVFERFEGHLSGPANPQILFLVADRWVTAVFRCPVAGMVNARIGIARAEQSQLLWLVDRNASGGWSGATLDGLYSFGQPGDVPVTGDWNGDGRGKIGFFRPSTGMWLLDYNGDGGWSGPASDRMYFFGQNGDTPVVGDWNASGTAKIGFFRPSTGMWLLDYDGNGQWNGPNADRQYYLGQNGDRPVAGDWNGDGRFKIGIFRPSAPDQGMWLLDYNGNGVWDGDATDRHFYFGEVAGDEPVVGRWQANGPHRVGFFRTAAGADRGMWLLDLNGNGRFDGSGVDGHYYFGQEAGDRPVIADWNGDGRTKIGVFRTNGLWLVDFNGDGVYTSGLDKLWSLGQAGDTPVVGSW